MYIKTLFTYKTFSTQKSWILSYNSVALLKLYDLLNVLEFLSFLDFVIFLKAFELFKLLKHLAHLLSEANLDTLVKMKSITSHFKIATIYLLVCTIQNFFFDEIIAHTVNEINVGLGNYHNTFI